jgi:dienelactone hydrolase
MQVALPYVVACAEAAPSAEVAAQSGAEGVPSATPPRPVATTPSGAAVTTPAPRPAGWSTHPVARGSAGSGPDVSVSVYTPARATGAWVLLLHGWNQHARDWGERTRVAGLAETAGWTLVAPDLGKSVYESRVYPGMGSTVAGLPWTRDVLVPWTVSALGLPDDPARRAVVGVSTGGRGAALLGETGRFAAVAAFSGTFDLAALAPGTGEYRIHAAVFGERAANAARWKAEDLTGRPPAATRWWLAHGGKDPYVPQAQTRTQAARLAASGVPVVTWLDADAGHDWPVWDAWLGRVGTALFAGPADGREGASPPALPPPAPTAVDPGRALREGPTAPPVPG